MIHQLHKGKERRWLIQITANHHQQVASKEKERKEILVKEVEKIPAFNLENEISKLKVSIPLTEIMRNNSYRG